MTKAAARRRPAMKFTARRRTKPARHIWATGLEAHQVPSMRAARAQVPNMRAPRERAWPLGPKSPRAQKGHWP